MTPPSVLLVAKGRAALRASAVSNGTSSLALAGGHRPRMRPKRGVCRRKPTSSARRSRATRSADLRDLAVGRRCGYAFSDSEDHQGRASWKRAGTVSIDSGDRRLHPMSVAVTENYMKQSRRGCCDALRASPRGARRTRARERLARSRLRRPQASTPLWIREDRAVLLEETRATVRSAARRPAGPNSSSNS